MAWATCELIANAPAMIKNLWRSAQERCVPVPFQCGLNERGTSPQVLQALEGLKIVEKDPNG